VSTFHIAVVPVGKVDRDETAAAIGRAAKILRQPMELRGSLPVPRVSEDPVRGQHRAATLMKQLRTSVLQLGPGELIGASEADARLPLRPDAYLFVTDVDLFTAKTDGVFAALNSAEGLAVISLRRLREAFYRRKADPGKLRARLSRELLRMAGRLRGLKECTDSTCTLAPSRSVADVDSKAEQFCRNCSQWLFEGKVRI
jgi:predicted Zn-dependent protease